MSNFISSLLASASQSNKQLDDMLASINEARANAKSPEDIQSIANDIEEFAKHSEFKYRNTGQIIFFCAMLIVSFIAWFLGEEGMIQGAVATIAWVAPIVVGFYVCIKGYGNKRRKVNEVAQFLMLKSVLIDNGLKTSQFDGRKTWQSLQEKLYDFRRGDESQWLQNLYSGSIDEKPFQLYGFRYVSVTTRTVTEYNHTTKRNETRTETTRTIGWRYGILLDFHGLSQFSLSGMGQSVYPCKWSTTSKRFNEYFEMTAADEMTLAKLLQPAVVLKLEECLLPISYVNLEVAKDGMLCLSTGDSSILPQAPECSLTDVSGYLKLLREKKTNRSLLSLFEPISVLQNYNQPSK